MRIPRKSILQVCNEVLEAAIRLFVKIACIFVGYGTATIIRGSAAGLAGSLIFFISAFGAFAELKKISPVTFIEVAPKRVLRLWVPLNRIVSDETGTKANLAVNLFYLPAMVLAAFGLWRARYNSTIVPLWTVFLYLTLLAAISWGGTRFRYPVEPFLSRIRGSRSS